MPTRDRPYDIGRSPIEMLESRVALDARGLWIAESGHMTISFAPDETLVGDQPNALFATFDGLADTAVWQQAVLRAFNVWAAHTNADVGSVADGGQEFGVPGQRRGDDRFGDVRVGAVPLADSVAAISFPRDNPALGTWAGDILFNSNLPWQSVDELFAVAVHEAGHIFGLEHSADPLSPMHTHGIPDSVVLTPNDISNVQSIYGVRRSDSNELAGTNDSSSSATELATDIAAQGIAITFGDVAGREDVDFYRLSTQSEIPGDVTIRVQSSGLSLLTPQVMIHNAEGQVLAMATAEDGIARMEHTFSKAGESVWVSIQADSDGVSASGRYSLVATVNPEELDEERLDNLNEFYFLSADELALEFMDDEEDEEDDFFWNDDEESEGEDDGPEEDFFDAARELVPTSVDTRFIWFDTFGSIARVGDQDLYAVEAPVEDDDETTDLGAITITVRSLDRGKLIPRVRLYDEGGQHYPTEVVVNGNGELVVQANGLQGEDEYVVIVEADESEGPWATGNYTLSVVFGKQPLSIESIFEAELTNAEPILNRSLHVATPQLFHFLLGVDGFLPGVDGETLSAGDLGVSADIIDANGNTVFQVSSPAGGERTNSAVLLLPGSYHVRFRSFGVTASPLGVTFSAVRASDPLGVAPIDPTSQPSFACDSVAGQFCYPGNVASDAPFFWSDVLPGSGDPVGNDLAVQPDPNLDWWSGVPGAGQTPISVTAVPDEYFAPADQPLQIDAGAGLLVNDQPSSLSVALVAGPKQGTLLLNQDGSFQYVPKPGFVGADQFSYQAFDANGISSSTVVTISDTRVGGDVDGDGSVSFTDFLALSANFGAASINWQDGDFDRDGRVGFSDFLVLAASFG